MLHHRKERLTWQIENFKICQTPAIKFDGDGQPSQSLLIDVDATQIEKF